VSVRVQPDNNRLLPSVLHRRCHAGIPSVMVRRALAILVPILIPIFSTVVSVAAPSATPHRTTLKLLFTHDLHSSLLPHARRSGDGTVRLRGGYAKLSAAIRHERFQHPENTVLVDAGDYSMGTLFHTLITKEAVELRLMGAMGYDAGTFGNHDFDFGLDGVAQSLDAARNSGEPTLPLVIANLNLPAGFPNTDRLRVACDAYGVHPYRVIERAGLRIGLFGLMGRDAASHTPFIGPASFQEAIPVAQQIVARLREVEHVDVVVCLSHMGTSTDPSHSEDEQLARDVPGIDVIVSGHTHTILPEPLKVGAAVIVSAGAYCSSLGVLELDVAERVVVGVASYRLVALDSTIPGDTSIAARIETFRRMIDSTYLRKFGLSFEQIIACSRFPLETVAYGYSHPGELGLGNLITDALQHAVREAEGPDSAPIDVAIEPLGMIRGSFDEGPISVSEVFHVLSLGRGPDGEPGYPLLAPYISGEDLLTLLEIDPMLAAWKGDAHLQFGGVRFSYNPYRLPLNRVTRAELVDRDGSTRPIDPDGLYRICVDYYTAVKMSTLKDLSWGLVGAQPRRADGTPVADFREMMIDADRVLPGVQELKEWVALAGYVRSFPPDTTGGLPTIPARYQGRSGRYGPEPSCNPIAILKSPNRFGVRAGGGLIVILGLGLLLVVFWQARKR